VKRDIIYIDAGTENLRLYSFREDILFEEPSYFGVSSGGKILLKGREARDFSGKETEDIKILKPVINGGISYPELLASEISFIVRKIFGKRAFSKPFFLFSFSPNANEIEKKGLLIVAKIPSARQAGLISSASGQAAFFDKDWLSPKSFFIGDFGAGKIDFSLSSFGRVVKSFRVSGGIDSLFKKVKNFLLVNRSIQIPSIYRNVAEILFDEAEEKTISGINRISKLPETTKLYRQEIQTLINNFYSEIILNEKDILKSISPEFSPELIEKGIFFCGGGARVKDFKSINEKEFGIKVTVPEKPENVLLEGIKRIVSENFNSLEKIAEVYKI